MAEVKVVVQGGTVIVPYEIELDLVEFAGLNKGDKVLADGGIFTVRFKRIDVYGDGRRKYLLFTEHES